MLLMYSIHTVWVPPVTVETTGLQAFLMQTILFSKATESNMHKLSITEGISFNNLFVFHHV